MIKIIVIGFLSLSLLSSCLKTRSEVSEQDQTAVYSKKNADNQAEAQTQTQAQIQANTAAPVEVDEKDELIRSLNGRVETLENQLAALLKAQEGAASQDSQKVQLLQEALTKLEAQMEKVEAELPMSKATDKVLKNIEDSDSVALKANAKKLGTYQVAEEYFSKQDWKKAILNFQKYTDETPKGKFVPDAKFKIGVCFQELGMKEEAMAFYEEVVANYGKTEAGKKSKAQLAKLKK